MAVPSGVIYGWPSTNASIPSGHSRVTALDARYVKMIATAGTNPGATGGSASHQHSYAAHTHTGGDHSHTNWGLFVGGGSPATAPHGGGTLSPNVENLQHNHQVASSSGASASSGASGGPANYDSATTTPAHLVVIFIKSDGSPSDIPASAIAYFNGAAPSGWAEYANGANRLWRGASAGGDGGGTAGSDATHTHTSPSHTHAQPAHTHTVTGASSTVGSNLHIAGTAGVSQHGHVHTYVSASGGGATSGGAAEGSAAGDDTPPWQKLLTIQNTSGSPSLPVGLIALWDGTLASIPSGWKLCDGTSGTPNLAQGRYVRGASGAGEVGNSGGSVSHTHGGVSHTHASGDAGHSHGYPGASSAPDLLTVNSTGSGSAPTDTHTHAPDSSSTPSTVAAGSLSAATPGTSSSVANDPTFTALAYIQFQNTAPNSPTILRPTVSSSWDRSIVLQAQTTDPEGDAWHATFEYQVDGGGWAVIGDGGTVVSGGISDRLWDTSLLVPSPNYKVRAKVTDALGAASAYTTMASPFTIHRPEFLALLMGV